MTEAIRHLQLPLTEDDARSLTLGGTVTVTGAVFTGRSWFHIRAVEELIVPPLDFKEINCFFHAGPVMREENGAWKVVSLEPTSSIRFERYSAEVIRKFTLRTLIGKTTMGAGTAEALREVGGVHLTKIGVCGNLLVPQVKKVCGVHFLEELGKTEATWVFAVERFGPFFVDMDAHGNNFFDNLDRDVQTHMQSVYQDLRVPQDYAYTNLNTESP